MIKLFLVHPVSHHMHTIFRPPELNLGNALFPTLVGHSWTHSLSRRLIGTECWSSKIGSMPFSWNSKWSSGVLKRSNSISLLLAPLAFFLIRPCLSMNLPSHSRIIFRALQTINLVFPSYASSSAISNHIYKSHYDKNSVFPFLSIFIWPLFLSHHSRASSNCKHWAATRELRYWDISFKLG